MVKRPTTFSMRMPEDLNEKIQNYATEHSCTKAEAMSHFARAGIDLEERGGVAISTPENDDPSAEALANIQRRLDALQNLPTITDEEQTRSIVPIDIKDKIQAYSTEHSCSEQDALTYYARLGVQMSDDMRPASLAQFAELNAKIDALAKDNAQKGEQLKQMAEVLVTIRDYTKPEELELEGEVADEAEDVEQAELTDEERQAIADEHTERIVKQTVSGLLSEQAASKQAPISPWIPVLAAVIVSLVIGIIVILVAR